MSFLLWSLVIWLGSPGLSFAWPTSFLAELSMSNLSLPLLTPESEPVLTTCFWSSGETLAPECHQGHLELN